MKVGVLSTCIIIVIEFGLTWKSVTRQGDMNCYNLNMYRINVGIIRGFKIILCYLDYEGTLKL